MYHDGMTTKRRRRAAIYCRISRDVEQTGLGVARQERECRELAEREGFDLVEPVFIDNDISAYRRKQRPGFEAVIGEMKAGNVDVLLAWHPDRITRHPRDLEDLIDLLEATGVDVATVSAGAYDLSTPAGRLGARTVGAAARYESEQKSERHKAKHRQLAAAGQLGGGGTRPYGYADDRITVVPEEAEVVREAARQILAGWSLRQVCRHLNDRGVPTVTGARWSPQVMRRLLIAPRTAGLRELQGEVVGEAAWEPLVDRQTWEGVAAVLQDPARRKNQTARRYLLTGLVYSTEGTKMIARPDQRKARRYIALPEDGRPGTAIHADELEALVVEAVLQRFDEAALPAGPAAPAGDVEAITAVEGDLDELARLRGEGEITLREWMAARAPLQERLAALRAGLRPAAATPAPLGRPGALRTSWPAMTFDQRREVLQTVLDRVVVGPAVRGRNRFDAGRVNLAYKV